MKRDLISLTLACFFALLLILLASVKVNNNFYCLRCGLKKSTGGYTTFGARMRWQERYHKGEFHRLYTQFVAAQCSHPWYHQSGSHRSLWGGEIGCGRIPFVLLRDESLRPLRRLRDKSKVVTILTSFDLTPHSLSERDLAMFEALAELEDVSDAEQEERWWSKHQRLFVQPRHKRSTDKEGE